MVRVRRRAGVIALLCLLSEASTTVGAADEAPTGLPPTASIYIAPSMRSVTARMLERSPTFRRQCDSIAESGSIFVTVRLVPASGNQLTRARTTLRRYSSGLMFAQVEIPADSQVAELIAHEFEHILEFIEGVDLPSLSRGRPSDVLALRDGSFETWRAVVAGRTAAQEMNRRLPERP